MKLAGAHVRGTPSELVPAEYGDAASVYEIAGVRLPVDRARFFRLWEWMFRENPASRAHEPVGWKAQRDGRILAFLGLVPTWVRADGVDVRAHVATTFVARQGEGIVGLRVAKAALDSSGEFIMNGSANSTTSAIFERFGCRAVPGVPSRRYVYPLSVRAIRRILERRLRRDRLHPARRVGLRAARTAAAVAGPVGSALLAAVFGINRVRLRLRGLRRRFACEPLSCSTTDITRIWERSSQRYRISVRRDPEYVQWRFSDFPLPGLRGRLVCEHNGRPVAYFILWHMQTLPGVLLLDLGHDPANPDSLRAAVGFALAEAADERADMFLAAAQCAAIDRELARWTLLAQQLEGPLWLYRNNTGVVREEALADPNAWWLTPSDGDMAYQL